MKYTMSPRSRSEQPRAVVASTKESNSLLVDGVDFNFHAKNCSVYTVRRVGKDQAFSAKLLFNVYNFYHSNYNLCVFLIISYAY